MTEFVHVHGYWWPAGSQDYCQRYVKRSPDLAKAIRNCKQKKVAVQAGGHCGVWPLCLVGHDFETVYTFEPDAANFACMSRNMVEKKAEDRIFAARGMLADAGRGPLAVSWSRLNIGGHKAKQEVGNVPTYTIDNLNLPACDLIVLDVEGMEVPALAGAADTIRRHRPVIMLEDNDNGSRYGWGGQSALRGMIDSLGYGVVDHVAKDIVCVSRLA